MAVTYDEEGVHFGVHHIAWTDFPDLVRAHLAKCPDTPASEKAGEDFAAEPTNEGAVDVIYRTCYWGGSNGPRILPQIMRGNSEQHMKECFVRALDALKDSHGLRGLDEALRCVNEISYLGQPSFASKMLRMLAGEWCAVLDSLVSDAASYPLDRRSFALYSSTCQEIARELERRGINNPRDRVGWWASDVDAGIFSKIRGW